MVTPTFISDKTAASSGVAITVNASIFKSLRYVTKNGKKNYSIKSSLAVNAFLLDSSVGLAYLRL